jgi:endonuclease YncB( thermonuclease family)
MRNATLPILLVLLLQAAIPLAAWGGGRVYHTSVVAQVVRVHDGDILTVTVRGWPALVSPIQFRLAGIDAPELRDVRPAIQSVAILARDWVAAHLRPGDTVTLRKVRRDKYFRALGDIEAVVDGDARDVASELLRRDLARPYSGRGPKPW